MTIEEYDNKKELRENIKLFDDIITLINKRGVFTFGDGIILTYTEDKYVIDKVLKIFEERRQQLIDEFEKK